MLKMVLNKVKDGHDQLLVVKRQGLKIVLEMVGCG